MGSICSKESSEPDQAQESKKVDSNSKNNSVQLIAPTLSLRDVFIAEDSGDASTVRLLSRNASRISNVLKDPDDVPKHQKRGTANHQRWATVEMAAKEKEAAMSRLISLPLGAESGNAAQRWPSWLTSVAGDAIAGWVPRRADSFEKLDKIGQGTYSSVYKAYDLETGKIVALKKVRFVNMDPDSVRFMAREIYILRKLDHPNVMKLEGIVASKTSNSLYLVFEYMDHDLSGLAATRGIKFTEPQIKCLMQQILSGLEHCHSLGVLHRDIKGSNLLINNEGVLKIGDFGLATCYEPNQKQPLTSRVATLWYRAPELLLGSTHYGPAIDLWSAGCILAELFAGKPIMTGRTEVEQMHKIFKLCGSPSEDFWKNSKLPHATSFKPQQPYKRRLADTFKDFPSTAFSLVDKLLAIEEENRGSAGSALKSTFFTTPPIACHPSALPQYPPSKEFDAKLRGLEKRQREVLVKGRGPESVRRAPTDAKIAPTADCNGHRSIQLGNNLKTMGHKYMPHQQDSVSGFAMEAPRRAGQNGYTQCSSLVHPSSGVGSSLNKTTASRNRVELRTQTSHKPLAASDLFKNDRLFIKEAGTRYVTKSRIHYSGPLVPPGGNMEDMLKDHDRHIQQAVRKARAR